MLKQFVGNLPTNCLSVFDHFVELAIKGLRKEKMYKTKTTEWQNVLKRTKNELKMKISWLTLYLNLFNENKLTFGRTLKKLFWFFLFLLRHSKVNLRTSTYIFYKSTAPANINSAAFSTFFKKSAFCGTQICLLCCGLWQHLTSPPPFPPKMSATLLPEGTVKCNHLAP